MKDEEKLTDEQVIQIAAVKFGTKVIQGPRVWKQIDEAAIVAFKEGAYFVLSMIAEKKVGTREAKREAEKSLMKYINSLRKAARMSGKDDKKSDK